MRTAALSGRQGFLVASGAEIAATGAQIAQWAAVSWLVGATLTGDIGGAGVAALLVGAAGLVAVAARWGARAAARRGAGQLSRGLRARLLSALLPSPGDGIPPAAATAGATALLEHVDEVTDFAAATEPARRSVLPSMVLVLVTVAVVHWPVAVLLGAATAIIPANMRLTGLAALEASRRRLRELDLLTATMFESFRGVSVLRSLGAVDRTRAKIERVSERLNRATTDVLRKALLSGVVMDAVVTFAIAVCASYVGLVLLGYVRLPGVPPLDLFAGILVLLLCPLYFAPLRRVSAGFHARDRATAAAEQLIPLLAHEGDAVARSTARDRDNTHAFADRAPEVRVRGLSYRPAAGAPDLFTNLDLTAHPGAWTVVTGASGAGKTTLLALIAGIRHPDAGSVVWRDQESESASPPQLRAATWIGQRTVVLEGTIADNLLLGDPDAPLERLQDAAARAGLGPLLARLDGGLHARVGDGGAGVSAGEARRIAIARALVRNAPVWILDEPTAHLDAASEREVLDSLAEAMAGRTVIVATHAPELIARGDAEWHVEAGEVRVTAVRGR